MSSFSVIGSPICTLAPATSPVVASIVALENVAPRKPSRPVRPPSTTTRSPACGPVSGGTFGRHADAAAEHERVGGEPGVVQHRAGDGGQADLVAVVGDAGDDALADQPRMEDAGRHQLVRQVGGSEAQDVGGGDGVVRGAHDVADDATDAGVRAAERLDRRRVVVRLGLHRDGGAGHERDDAGVADERAAHERRVEVGGGVAQLNEQRRDRRPVGQGDGRAERLVCAVLAPRLGQRLELDVGRRATRRLGTSRR